MASLTWSTSHAVWITEIDDQHKEIFEEISHLQEDLSSDASPASIRKRTQRLFTCIADHFAHEERLMRAARYGSLRWHKQAHDNATRRVRQFMRRIEDGDTAAGKLLIEYLTSFLGNHTALADRMMGAFLRNELRCLGKLTFRAGTRPEEACAWVNAKGEKFDPRSDGL